MKKNSVIKCLLFMPPQTLITGATGFIGRALTRSLLARGDSVRVLARSRGKARSLFGDHVEIVTGDLGDAAALDRACREVGVVYHVAGSYRFGLRHRRELWRTNVEGADRLFRAAHAAGVERVVHLSSGGVLERCGGVQAEALLTEDDFPAVAPRWCAYKSSKWQAEKRALAWAARGLPVVIASTTCPIGRGDESPTPTGRMIRDFLHRRFPFSCRTGLNFIGIDDLSDGLRLAAERGRPGERYLISHENLWLEDFLRQLAEETDLPPPAFRLPGGLVRVIGAAGEIVDLLTPRGHTARVCLETALQAGRCQFFSNAKARRELGWQPATPIAEAVRDAVVWFRDEVMLDLPPPAPASAGSHVR
jgi:dihydroflavonol-4-reductase